MKTDPCTTSSKRVGRNTYKMIYPTFTDLIAHEVMDALTQGVSEAVGRTRLGSLFTNGWLQAPYGERTNRIIPPVFQRSATAWSDLKKRTFLLNAISGSMTSLGHFIIFNERETGDFALLDGQHRLTTVQQFINGEFHVTIGNRKKVTYDKLTDEEQATLHNIIADVKIYIHLTEEQERAKYLELNESSPLNADARLHALRNSEERQAMFRLCDEIMAEDDNENYARIRELLQLTSDANPQAYEGKLLPFLSILITGDKVTSKGCVNLAVPEDMDRRIHELVLATWHLDSAKADLTRFLGPIAHDIQAHPEDTAIVKRWDALIRQDKRTNVWLRAVVHDRPRWNRDAKRTEFAARCARIRELYAEDGTYLGPA